MATVLQPSEGVEVKLRRPSAVAALSVVTLGIYPIVWYYKVNREMRDFGAGRGDSRLAASRPWSSVVAMTVGGLIVIPRIVTFVRTVGRMQAVERIATGASRPASGLTVALVGAVILPLGVQVHRIGVYLALAGVVAFVAAISLIQARLNAAWRATDGADHAPVDGDGSTAGRGREAGWSAELELASKR
jgi:hypothetical protein